MDDSILIEKLDEFIRKYYRNQLVRGLIFTLSLLTGIYLLLIGLEYNFYFSTYVRALFLFIYISLIIFTFIRLVLFPLLRIYKIGKILSHENAAIIIGEHFTEIQDKLLNALQLIKQNQAQPEHIELIVAGIEQKTKFLKVFDFRKIIQIRNNFKFFKYLIPIVGLLLFLVFFFPEFISGPTSRIVLFNQTFSAPLPFQIEVLNDNFKAMQQEDFKVSVRVRGEEIPKELFVISNGLNHRMVKETPNLYSYIFKALQSDVGFFIQAGKFQSREYRIRVFPKPIIIHFELSVKYPEYLKKSNEKIDNTSDLTVPEGTEISWNILTKDADMVVLRFSDKTEACTKFAEGSFKYTRKFLESMNYTLLPGNSYTYKPDSLPCKITVVKDAFPAISIVQDFDSAISASFFFRGVIKDDYGFSKLAFKYEVIEQGSSVETVARVIPLNISDAETSQNFLFNVNQSEFNANPGETIKYYFEIWDNDGIHGPKSTKSEIQQLKILTVEEIAENTEKKSQKIEKGLENSYKETKSIKKKIEELNLEKMEKNSISWQDKKKAEEVISSFDRLSEQIEKLSQENIKNILNEQEFLKTSERISEKQKELNEMMKNLLSEEMKKDIQEMKKMLDQVDKKKLDELLEKMSITNKELESQLDRTLELYKKIEFDRKLELEVGKLKELAKKQEDLADEAKSNEKSKQELVSNQEDIQQKFDSIKKSLENLVSEGKQLDNVPDIEKTKDKQNDISSQLEKSMQLLDKKGKEGARKAQKEASGKMNELADQLEEMQEDAEEMDEGENAESLRKILENLVDLSLLEESMMYETKMISRSDPRLQDLIVRQRDMKEKCKSVEDSLVALSKREISVQPVISKELSGIKEGIEKAIDQMNERNIAAAAVSQQYTMTAMNNLAVLLSEALNKSNMEQQANSKSKKSKSCKSPSSKGGKKSMKSLKDLQGQISEQMKKIKEGLDKEKKSGKGKLSGNQELNREIARLAAQQEALRRELQTYQQQSGKASKTENENLSKLLNEIAENERDLIFKKVTQESINRQQKIMSRLLEAEKAEEMRDFEEKRQAERVINQKYSNPNAKIKYNYERKKEDEMLRRSQLPVKSFFRNRSNLYLIQIQ